MPFRENPAKCIDALVAGPPSPEKPSEPLPATVVTTPLGVTFRILKEFATNIFPAESTEIPVGSLKGAFTKVVIFPFGSTFRIRLFQESAMYRLPDPSRANPSGG